MSNDRLGALEIRRQQHFEQCPIVSVAVVERSHGDALETVTEINMLNDQDRGKIVTALFQKGMKSGNMGSTLKINQTNAESTPQAVLAVLESLGYFDQEELKKIYKNLGLDVRQRTQGVA